jgi:hypothetical protein
MQERLLLTGGEPIVLSMVLYRASDMFYALPHVSFLSPLCLLFTALRFLWVSFFTL